MRHSSWRRLLASALALSALALMLLAAPAAAVQSTLDLLLDLDDDATTGCTVSTPDGPFEGVEQILTTTVDTVGAAAANVTGVVRSECVDPGTGTFGAPVAVDAGGWPVGVGSGVDGFHVVETYFPLAATALDLSVVRFGVVQSRGMEADALLVAAPGSDLPLLVSLQNVLEIPTLGQWGLLLLALLLAASSVALLGRRGWAALVAILILGTAGLAWAQCVLDGLPDDWDPEDLVGEEPAAADDGVSIRAVFGRGGLTELCFRVDLSLLFDQPPTITPIADQTIPEDGATGALAFTVGDVEDAASALVVAATSSNQVLVPDANLVLGGTGANRTVTVTPAANQNGTTTVTVTVQDSAGNTEQTSFLVTVTSDNDPPTITAIADQAILEDSTTGALAFIVGDVETPAGSLMVSASSSDQTIIPDANLVLGGAGANRTLTVTPAADQNGGPVTITVLVQDTDGGSTPEQLAVTVTPVNDPPSFSLAGDVASDEDAGAQTVPSQATAVVAGPADEVGQAVSFLVSNDDNALFSAQPAIDASGTLSYTAAADAYGSALVTVQAMDNGGTANGGVDTSAAQTFTITVNPVNDPPTVTNSVISYQTVGNTLLRVDGATDGAAGHDVPLPGRVASTTDTTDAVQKAGPSDPDSAAVGFVPGTYATTLAGSLTIDDDGDLFYVPPVGVEGVDSVVVDVADGDGGMVPVTIQVTVSEMVWYVEDTVDGSKNPAAGGPGTSVDAFETLGAAEAASGPGDTIFVFETDSALDQSIALQSGQKLYGQPVADLMPALLPTGLLIEPIADTDARPVIDRSTGDAVTVLADAGNGDRSGVEIRSLDITAQDNAIDVSAADSNNLDVVLTDNVLSSVSGASLLVDGSGSTGTTVVRELSGTSVATSGGGGGELFESVTFDADVVTAGIQPVSGGDVNVGNPASPGDVVGHGVHLDNVRGILDFGTLSVGNTGGVGLFVRDADGKGGTFVLDTDGGAINTVDGPAVDLDPVGLGLGGVDGMVLDSVTVSVTSTTVPYGINLDTVSGSFQVTGATSVGASGGGTLTVGVAATDATAAITFTGPTTVDTTADAGIKLTNVDGPVIVASAMSNVTGAGGAAIDVDQGLGDFTYNGSIDNTAGRSVEVTNHGGPAGGSTVALTGSITDSGIGVFLDNNDQGAGGSVVNLTGSLDLSTGSSTALSAINGGVVNVTDPANDNQITTTTGVGVTITSTTIGTSGVKLTTVDVGDADAAAPNAQYGILLTNAGSGAFTATGGSIQNVTARGLQVLGGTGDVSLGASISTTDTGRSLEVTGHTGGTVSVSGAIDDNGLGVYLDSNTGGTVTITGSMDVDTVGANTGFNATGGGTVNVLTGVNDVDTSAGTGIAVNIANTTIGPSGVTFRSVSADGATSGIVLNATGANPFEVTGEGASDPTVVVGTRGRTLSLSGGGTMSGLGTGGVIRNTVGDGVSLTDTNAVLRNLTVGDPTAVVGQAADGTVSVGDDGVSVTGNGSLVLDNVLISRTATHGIRAANTSDVTILNTEVLNAGTAVDEDGADFSELLGTSSITSSVFDGMSSRGLDVQNDTKSSAMTPDALVVRNTQVSNSDPITGENGIRFVSLASGNFSLTVHDSLIQEVEGNGIGVFSSGSNAADPSNAHLEVQRTTIIGTGSPDVTVPTAIQVNPSFEGTSTFDILNNNATDGGGFSGIPTAGIIIKNDSNGLLRGTIDNNEVSSEGEGAFVVADGAIGMTSVTGDVQVTITNNTFTSSGAHGMSFSAQDGAVSLEAKVGGNATTAGGPAFSFQNGVFMDVQSGTACFNLATAGGAGNNVATGAGSGEGIFLQKTGGSVILQGYGGGNDAAAATFLNANNTSSPAASVFSGDTVGTGTCSNTP